MKTDIFFLDPNSDIVEIRAREERNTLKSEIQRAIKFFHELKNKLPPQSQDRFKLWAYRATPTVCITLVDNYMIVTHYLASFLNRHAPCYHIVKPVGAGQRTLFDQHEENLQNIMRRENTIEITRDNIKSFTGEVN